MHIAVIFMSIGHYHAARLREASRSCSERGWHITAIQAVEGTSQHPWGTIENSPDTYPTKTLLTPATARQSADDGWLNVEAAKNIKECLNELKPDVVVIPGWGGRLERESLVWAQRHRIPAVVMSESKRDDAKRQQWKEKLKSRLYISKFDAALVGGKLHRDYLVELGFAPERIFTGYDVVDNDYFERSADIARRNVIAARASDTRIPSRPFFLATTRFIKRKNIERLIEAYAEYNQQETETWDLVVCGAGEEEQSIRRRITEENLEDRVHLPGFVTYEQVGAWYGLAHAFIHPALQEQWGLVVNEACAAGLPILCSRTVGAGHELVRENQNGLLFDPQSREDMTRSLKMMHSFDDAKRRAMAEVSRRLVWDFRPQKFGEGLVRAVSVTMRTKSKSQGGKN